MLVAFKGHNTLSLELRAGLTDSGSAAMDRPEPTSWNLSVTLGQEPMGGWSKGGVLVRVASAVALVSWTFCFGLTSELTRIRKFQKNLSLVSVATTTNSKQVKYFKVFF